MLSLAGCLNFSMSKILQVNNVSDYEHYVGYKNLHPLVSVIPYEAVTPIRHSRTKFNVYALFLRDDRLEELSYGAGRYDYGEGTLIAVSPGQIGGVEDNGEVFDIKGWALLFHPELLRGTSLENKMSQFTYFSYHINEALHMTSGERKIIIKCFQLIKDELENEDKLNQNAIVISLIEAVLGYCLRFYNRQFTARKIENSDVLVRFEQVLNDYYNAEKQLTDGIPTVKYCSEQLFLSANYFGDLVKKETGNSPNHFIQNFIINKAKSELFANRSVSEAAFNLGFEYSQAFSRFFKLHTGKTPLEYIKSKSK
jgi:AraC-like DNA-binding protein